jgi:hypothetical protein
MIELVHGRHPSGAPPRRQTGRQHRCLSMTGTPGYAASVARAPKTLVLRLRPMHGRPGANCTRSFNSLCVALPIGSGGSRRCSHHWNRPVRGREDETAARSVNPEGLGSPRASRLPPEKPIHHTLHGPHLRRRSLKDARGANGWAGQTSNRSLPQFGHPKTSRLLM